MIKDDPQGFGKNYSPISFVILWPVLCASGVLTPLCSMFLWCCIDLYILIA